MSVFLVTPLSNNAGLVKAAIAEHVGEGDWYGLPNEAGYLVTFRGTTVELSNLLTITGQEPGQKSPIGAAMVTLVASYFGRGPTDMWEWMKTRFEASS